LTFREVLVLVHRGLGQDHRGIAAGCRSGERIHDLGAVTVEVPGGLAGETGRRSGVVIIEQRRFVDPEVELLPDRIRGERGRDCRAVVVRTTATPIRARLGGSWAAVPVMYAAFSEYTRLAFLPSLSSWCAASVFFERFM